MTIRIHVHARSSRNEIVESKGALHAYVTAPPVDDKANLAVRELIAERWSVPKSRVVLTRGAKSASKEFEI